MSIFRTRGMLSPATIGAILVICLLFLLLDCSGDGGGQHVSPSSPLEQAPEPETPPFTEIIDQGITRYVGMYSPMLATNVGYETTHLFGKGDGPLCIKGGEYTVSTRDLGSENLMIFLEGGGACWSELCRGNTTTSPYIPEVGILKQDIPSNPLQAWNIVYVPYCDGSFFTGDVDLDYNNNGLIDRHHRGLKNLSAALDVAVNIFPKPRRILLAGSSAGGYGTTFALPLVRHLYHDATIQVLNDSGVGILSPGTIEKMLVEWNASEFLPASCGDCIDEFGTLVNYYAWQLGEDKGIRMGMMSYREDRVMANVFSDIGPDLFQARLKYEAGVLRSKYPERFKTFLRDGVGHSFLMYGYDVSAGDVYVMDWIRAMVEDSPDWVSVAD